MTTIPRRTPTRSDQGSMPLAMLITLVGMLVSAALVPIVINQVTGTRTVAERTDQVQAAQAGIDVALGQLRSAGADGKGSLSKLPPCVMTGSAGPDGGNYRVTIQYYRLGDDAESPEPMACPPTSVPVSATLTVTGGPGLAEDLRPGGKGTRTLDATYTFRTSNENIVGGAIVVAEPTANPLCMSAGVDVSPAPGMPLKVQSCKTGGSSEQRFAYTSDLNIKLVGSETKTAAAGMCVEVAYPRSNGKAAVFRPCAGASKPQQWSLNDSSNFRGTPDPAKPNENLCLNLAKPGQKDSDIVLGNCGGGGNARIFRPKPEAGAGMASGATGQLVNFRQFSRCLDVTDFKTDAKYMIVWFCKQSPDGVVPWNQKWSFPEQTTSAANAKPGRIRSGSAGYCLKSPGSTAPDKYVTLGRCPASGPLTDENLTWTVYGDTGNYASSYRIVDAFGYCLVPTDLAVPNPDTHHDGTAKVKVAPCSKSELQKWNAPANLNQPLVLTNTRER